jgi:hypothetical protein
MNVPDGFFTTKVTVEVEVTHQFNPAQGIGLVVGLLKLPTAPAVQSVKVLAAESNYKLWSKPMDEMVKLDLDALPK